MTEKQPSLHDATSMVNTHMNDTLGVLFLGMLSLFLLSALLRSNRRYRKLVEQILGKEA